MKNTEEKISKNKVIAWNSYLDKKYGQSGTPSLSAFEIKAQSFILAELLQTKTGT